MLPQKITTIEMWLFYKYLLYFHIIVAECSVAHVDACGKLFEAVAEVVDLTFLAFSENDLKAAAKVEPLEQVVDDLKEQLRQNHIARLQRGECTIEAGFIWTDLLTALNRTSDHCSNVAACVLDTAEGNLNLHEFLRDIKENDEYFKKEYAVYQKKYAVAPVK